VGSIEKKQAERRHGGYRPGAGRKSKYGVKTIVMRVPEDRVQEVQNLIGGGGLEFVTEPKHEIVTESVESVTESKAEPIEDMRCIVERWGEKLVPHQDANGQVKQPRWSKCWEMWQELSQTLKQSESPRPQDEGN
jgi:hypothetical protein